MTDEPAQLNRKSFKVSPELHELVLRMASNYGLTVDGVLTFSCKFLQDHYSRDGMVSFSLENPHMLRQLMVLNQTMEIIAIQNAEIVTAIKQLEEGSLKALISATHHVIEKAQKA